MRGGWWERREARDAAGKKAPPIPGCGGSSAGRRRLIGRHCHQHPAPGEEREGSQGIEEQVEGRLGGPEGQDEDGVVGPSWDGWVDGG